MTTLGALHDGDAANVWAASPRGGITIGGSNLIVALFDITIYHYTQEHGDGDDQQYDHYWFRAAGSNCCPEICDERRSDNGGGHEEQEKYHKF